MNFIDEATIFLKAGDGGNGCVAFRREAHVPRGGPSGGNGGNGGDIVFVASLQLSTLLDFKYRKHYKAERGQDGQNREKFGRAGVTLELHVPVGTVVKDAATDEIVADLDTPNKRCVVAEGGEGGLGNLHFATPWNQAPRTSTQGKPGVERTLYLELKLMADVGLLGYPNVGKSTFIAKVSAARPKIADYPFTTLAPSLGVCRISDERVMVIADIPGLIEGAADGTGLGLQFLRHVERTQVLLHVLDASYLAGPDREPLKDFDTVNRELAKYSPELAKRPQIVVLGKCDLTDVDEAWPGVEKAFAERGISVLRMSAATGDGIKDVLEALWRTLHPSPQEQNYATTK